MDGEELLSTHFPEIPDAQASKLHQLATIIARENQKVNVISRKDIDALYTRHLVHSLILTKIIHFKPGTHLLDAGTGGGFPGLPLSIFFPESRFTLVDSTRKKLSVIQTAIDELELTNVVTDHSRVESFKGSFDFILGRAVTELPRFLAWTKDNLKTKGFNAYPNGVFYWKGGELEAAVKKRNHQVFMLRDYVDLPEFEGKYIVYCKGSKAQKR